MDDNKGYPKYQYSVFIKNGRDQQIVVRADTIDEFTKEIKEIDLVLALDKVDSSKNVVVSQPIIQPETQVLPQTEEQGSIVAPMCKVHNKPMTLREGKFGKFWSCSTKLADGTWCKYHPSNLVEDMP